MPDLVTYRVRATLVEPGGASHPPNSYYRVLEGDDAPGGLLLVGSEEGEFHLIENGRPVPAGLSVLGRVVSIEPPRFPRKPASRH